MQDHPRPERARTQRPADKSSVAKRRRGTRFAVDLLGPIIGAQKYAGQTFRWDYANGPFQTGRMARGTARQAGASSVEAEATVKPSQRRVTGTARSLFKI